MVVVLRSSLLLLVLGSTPAGCFQEAEDPDQDGPDGDADPDPDDCDAWQVEQVDVGARAPTLELDATGTPHLLYWRCTREGDPGSCALVHATRGEAGWTPTVVGTDPVSAQLAFDPSGAPLVAYGTYAEPRHPIRVSTWTADGWDDAPVEVDGAALRVESGLFRFFVGSDGTPRLAYVTEDQDSALVVVTGDGAGGWTAETVAIAPQPVGWRLSAPFVVEDADGRPRVVVDGLQAILEAGVWRTSDLDLGGSLLTIQSGPDGTLHAVHLSDERWEEGKGLLGAGIHYASDASGEWQSVEVVSRRCGSDTGWSGDALLTLDDEGRAHLLAGDCEGGRLLRVVDGEVEVVRDLGDPPGEVAGLVVDAGVTHELYQGQFGSPGATYRTDRSGAVAVEDPGPRWQGAWAATMAVQDGVEHLAWILDDEPNPLLHARRGCSSAP